ncbi:MAG: deoxyribonuclease IV [Bradymonadaceae bacterium]
MQLFTKNNNRWEQRMWTEEEARKFRETYEDSPLEGLISHSAYLINLCSSTESTVDKSRRALADEMTRCQLLGIPYLVLHPGSHTGRGEEEGIEMIAENIDRVYDEADEGEWEDVTLLLENMAGQGTSIGYRFEHLADILERLEVAERVGICFDTCHAHAAGYDLTVEDSYEAVWGEFDEVIGLEQLEALHLNGSKREFDSRVDRHDHVGEGEIGLETFERLVNDPRFEGLPAAVETPPLDDGEPSFEYNVSKLKELRGDDAPI